jgi:CspA family cold shock protein
MLTLDELEPGLAVTHKNTGLRYAIGDVADDEVLLTPVDSDLQDLLVPIDLFRTEFVTAERYSARRSRGRRRGSSSAPATPTGPKVRGRIKKMVRDRGFGFIRGDDGKEVFFHRSGLGGADYDILNEGDIVDYHVSESPRGPRAENVRQAVPDTAA